ncbi:MAG: hypothetical protein J6Y53_04830 [Alphaproteobacteria bacterium]|nr:hypothetical protein [Alphaproteobacteria bacterium]
MKKTSLSVTMTMAFMTFGFILAGLINLINESNINNTVIIAATGIIATTSLIMLLINTIIAAKIIDSPQLVERVPNKLIGASLSLTALLLTASIAAFILAILVKPAQNLYLAMFILMGLLSLPQSVTSANIDFRLRLN